MKNFNGLVVSTLVASMIVTMGAITINTISNTSSDSNVMETTTIGTTVTDETTTTYSIEDCHIYIGAYDNLIVDPVNVIYNVTESESTTTTEEVTTTTEITTTEITTTPIIEATTAEEITTTTEITIEPMIAEETTTITEITTTEEINERPEIYDCTLSEYLQEYTYNLCNEYGIPYELVMAVMKKESAYQTTAYSGNSYGLMQINIINYKYAQNLGVYDLYDPAGNILVGVNLLSELMERHTVSDALICYNVGETAAKNKGLLGNSTGYSDTVLGYYYEYLN